MAEAYFRHFAPGNIEVISAGTHPEAVNPMAIAVMKEDGIDISSHTGKSVNQFSNQKFDYIITVCDKARENCPYFPGRGKRIHRSFEDPAAVSGTDAEMLQAFRKVQNEIKNWVREFVQKEFGDDTPAVTGLY